MANTTTTPAVSGSEATGLTPHFYLSTTLGIRPADALTIEPLRVTPKRALRPAL